MRKCEYQKKLFVENSYFMETYNPWPKNVALKILAGIWCSPVFLIGFILFLLLLLFQQVKNNGWKDGALDIVCLKDSWLQKKMLNKWAGFCIGLCVFYVDERERNNETTRDHERVHVNQQLKLGIFEPIFYGLFCVVIFLGCNIHAYYTNPFELDAKIKAGQIIEIDKLHPKDGDRWPW